MQRLGVQKIHTCSAGNDQVEAHRKIWQLVSGLLAWHSTHTLVVKAFEDYPRWLSFSYLWSDRLIASPYSRSRKCIQAISSVFPFCIRNGPILQFATYYGEGLLRVCCAGSQMSKWGEISFFSCFSQPLFLVTQGKREQVARQKPSKALFKSFYFEVGVGKCKGYIPDRLSNGLNISLGILSKRETLRGCPKSRVS